MQLYNFIYFQHLIKLPESQCLTRKQSILFLNYQPMTTKPGEQPVDTQTRDGVFAELKGINDNNICIDCEKKNPKWASIPLGIHLCYDCAGKHRQYGVVISFVKSLNLDTWNQRQIIFMQKGGNTRALDFFRKRGIITAANRTIDYKSQIVKQYKDLLAEQVDTELLGGKKQKKMELQKKPIDDFFNELEKQPEQKKIEIPKAEVVQVQAQKPKKKKEKKKIGAKQINLQDFESIAFDDGVPFEQKDKIVKEYEKKKDVDTNQQSSSKQNFNSSQEPQIPKIEQPKELSEQQVQKKMEELKLQSNLKNISSESFKDTSIDNVTLKQNLNKFTGSTSISSAAFFNKEEQRPSGQAIQNLKGLVSNINNVGQNLLSKLWKK